MSADQPATPTTTPATTAQVVNDIDKAIALETVKLTSEALGAGKWTWAVVGSLVFIVSVDGAKKMIVKLADSAIDYVCKMSANDWKQVGSSILSPFKLVGRGITLPYRMYMRKYNITVDKKEIKVPCFQQTFDLDINGQVWQAIWNLPNLCYDHTIPKVQQTKDVITQV